MNVAIFGVDPPSQMVAQIINQQYNPLLEEQLGKRLSVVAFNKHYNASREKQREEKLNVVAFVTDGGGVRYIIRGSTWRRRNFKFITIRRALP